MSNLGKTIKALRKMRGMTQGELAKQCGLERTSITNIEAGRQVLQERTMRAIAEALGYRLVFRFERVAQDHMPPAINVK